jgi:hypothetical protein
MAHRSNWTTSKVIRRPGASAMVVQIEKKKFAPLTKDNVSFFSDSGGHHLSQLSQAINVLFT